MISDNLMRLTHIANCHVMHITSVMADIYVEDFLVERKDIGVSTLMRLCEKYDKRACELLNTRVTLDEERSLVWTDTERLNADIKALRENKLYQALCFDENLLGTNYKCWDSREKELLKDYTVTKTGTVYYVVNAVFALPPGTNPKHFVPTQIL